MINYLLTLMILAAAAPCLAGTTHVGLAPTLQWHHSASPDANASGGVFYADHLWEATDRWYWGPELQLFQEHGFQQTATRTNLQLQQDRQLGFMGGLQLRYFPTDTEASSWSLSLGKGVSTYDQRLFDNNSYSFQEIQTARIRRDVISATLQWHYPLQESLSLNLGAIQRQGVLTNPGESGIVAYQQANARGLDLNPTSAALTAVAEKAKQPRVIQTSSVFMGIEWMY